MNGNTEKPAPAAAGGKDKAGKGKPRKSEAVAEKNRSLGQALRRNLGKRKAQAREQAK